MYMCIWHVHCRSSSRLRSRMYMCMACALQVIISSEVTHVHVYMACALQVIISSEVAHVYVYGMCAAGHHLV